MKLVNKSTAIAMIFLFPCINPAPAIAADPPENEFLEMDLSQLMNVTITSVSKKEQKLSDAAAAVFVITQEDIRRSGVTHIAEALAMAPGLQVARISASKWSVSSRGFAGYTSNKLLVMIDGRSVYSPAYSGTFWDMQNTLLEDIDRIEVIRGPGGTIWGANAVNGVINIITKNSKDSAGGLVRAGFGDQETLQGAARYGGKLSENTYGRIYATYNDRDSNKLAYVSDMDANDDWQNIQTGFRVDGTPKTQSEWTLQGDIYKNQGDQLLFPYWVDGPPYLTQKYSTLDSSGSNLLGRYRHNTSADSALTVQAYYDYNDRQEDYYQATFNTVDLEVQYETNLGQRNSITTGGGYRLVDGSFVGNFQVQLNDRTDSIYSAFLQDEILLLEDTLWFTAGIKYEHNDYTGSEWQPSGKILWKPRERHSIWASVARAVRTPSTVEHDGKVLAAAYPTPVGTGTTYIRGTEDFDPEIVLAYEAGYRWQASSALSFDTAIFYNDYSDLYSLAPGNNPYSSDLYFVNGVEGNAFGLEFVVDWKPASWLSFILTYAYLELDLNNDITTSTLTTDFISKASPTNQASLRSSIDLSKNWQVNFWLRYTDSITARNSTNVLTDELEVDSYFLFDLNIIWKATEDLEVMLAGQGLFNDGQIQYISELITPATEIQPAVYLKMTYTF